MSTFFAGFLLSFSLILAIGAQNAFVLKQGLRGEHVVPIVLTCAISDAILIAAGVAGFGALVEAAPWIDPVMRYGGAAFLLFYAWRSLRSALKAGEGMDPSQREAGSLKTALLTCLAFTWLNPHVYLDTVVLLGSISAGYGADAWVFGWGAMLASFVFFASLGFGAVMLRPFFANPTAWRVLDGLVALTMLAIAISLILH